MPVRLFLSLSIFLSLSVSVFLSLCFSVCLYLYLSVSLSTKRITLLTKKNEKNIQISRNVWILIIVLLVSAAF